MWGAIPYRKFWLAALACLVGGSVLVAGGLFFHWWSASPLPPVVDLEGVDPEVAAAVRLADRQVRETPRSADAWGLLGQVLLANEFFAPAEMCLRRAEELDPREPRWPYLQAAINPMTNPQTEAKLRRTIELTTDVAPRLRLADWLLGRGRIADADREFRDVLALEDGNPWAVLGRSRTALARGQFQTALGLLDPPSGQPSSARRVTPRSYHALRAEIFQRLGKKDLAAQESRLFHDLPKDPRPPDSFAQRAEMLAVGLQGRLKRADQHLKDGQFPEAMEILEPLSRDYPTSATVWLRLTRVLIGLRAPADAERAAHNAVRLAPSSVESHYLLGLVRLETGETARAAASFRQAVDLQPTFAPALLALGQAHAKMGDREEAIKVLRQAVHAAPQTASTHRALGEQLALAGKKEEAVAHVRDALRLEPDNPGTQALLQRLERK